MSSLADNPPTCSPNKFFGGREPWRRRVFHGRYHGLCPWGSIIAFLKRPKEFRKKEGLDKILTKKYSFDINCTILILGLTFAHEMR
jgi:hypothetical protein